ncbi:hypothetical protein KFL_002130210 [Klebsormidium nitens]|uniref:MYND-type domain-containing protein n=1 Tax=Klebsormidium nitens TaxID=105231 RepID=A0A1Y1I202_KLENI|nr:hypothetical protein KFL_002130210 [Klebsormidium nitens]|eukprot:GAQ84944.1 hypothetical protein KFL_002130210 [Klebsormidium nitens]
MAAMSSAQWISTLQAQHEKIERSADDPAALTEAFIAVAECMEHYFLTSNEEVQSSDIQASMAKFAWAWVELPQFPVRKLLPAAAKALQRFPQHRGLALAIADWCKDVCTQNVQAKMEAMQCGMLQGLCLAAGHLALCEEFREDEYLLAGCIFEALRKAAEPPGVAFYSRPLAVKNEFYSVATNTWGAVQLDSAVLAALVKRGDFKDFGAVNHALLLTTYFVQRYSRAMVHDKRRHEGIVEHYLEVVKTLGEAFNFQFPKLAGNEAFQRYFKRTFEEASRLDFQYEDYIDQFDEILLMHKRTFSASQVPYDHRNPCLPPARNRQCFSDFRYVSERQTSQDIHQNWGIRLSERRNVLKIARKYAAAGADAGAGSVAPGAFANADIGEKSRANKASASMRECGDKTRTCANCSRVQEERTPAELVFQKCSRCKAAYYCGRECQKGHWKEHKLVCAPRHFASQTCS